MITSILLAAAISLTASPAAYDGAQAYQSYQITITSGSPVAMMVHATLAPDNACSINLSRTPSWAHMSGPASFILASHASRHFVVSVGQPPPGKSELIAAFVASDPNPKTGVSTSAGVGTALRFSEPGKNVVPPCPKPKTSHNPRVRTVYVGSSSANSGAGISAAFTAGVAVTALILGLLMAIAIRRRPRLFKRGSHHS